jgi:hypothetical protein
MIANGNAVRHNDVIFCWQRRLVHKFIFINDVIPKSHRCYWSKSAVFRVPECPLITAVLRHKNSLMWQVKLSASSITCLLYTYPHKISLLIASQSATMTCYEEDHLSVDVFLHLLCYYVLSWLFQCYWSASLTKYTKSHRWLSFYRNFNVLVKYIRTCLHLHVAFCWLEDMTNIQESDIAHPTSTVPSKILYLAVIHRTEHTSRLLNQTQSLPC